MIEDTIKSVLGEDCESDSETEKVDKDCESDSDSEPCTLPP